MQTRKKFTELDLRTEPVVNTKEEQRTRFCSRFLLLEEQCTVTDSGLVAVCPGAEGCLGHVCECVCGHTPICSLLQHRSSIVMFWHLTGGLCQFPCLTLSWDLNKKDRWFIFPVKTVNTSSILGRTSFKVSHLVFLWEINPPPAGFWI